MARTTHRTAWVIAVVVLLTLLAAFLVRRALLGVEVPVVQSIVGEIVETVVSSGRVLAPAQVTIAAFASSTVARVEVDEGQVVAEGQLLAKLDDRELAAAVRRAEAQFARASAGTLELRRLSQPAARERLRQAQLALEQAARDFSQNEALSHGGSLPAATLAQSRTQLAVARSQVQAAELQLSAAAERGSQSLGANAALAQAKAELVTAQLALERTRLVSPLAGVVLKRFIEVGELAQPGTPAFSISASGPARLLIEPDERNLALLRPGQRALASAEAFPKQRFAAAVDYVAPSIDARRGTIEVRLRVPDAPAYLKPDMTVSVEIEVARKAQALVLPSGAVHDLAGEQPWVFVLEEGRARKRPITTGLSGDATVEIVHGLREGEPVIANGPGVLMPGTRVHAARERQ